MRFNLFRDGAKRCPKSGLARLRRLGGAHPDSIMDLKILALGPVSVLQYGPGAVHSPVGLRAEQTRRIDKPSSTPEIMRNYSVRILAALCRAGDLSLSRLKRSAWRLCMFYKNCRLQVAILALIPNRKTLISSELVKSDETDLTLFVKSNIVQDR